MHSFAFSRIIFRVGLLTHETVTISRYTVYGELGVYTGDYPYIPNTPRRSTPYIPI